MALTDFVPERMYKPLARFAGYGLVVLAIAAPAYLMDRGYSRKLREQGEAFQQAILERDRQRTDDLRTIRGLLEKNLRALGEQKEEITRLEEKTSTLLVTPPRPPGFKSGGWWTYKPNPDEGMWSYHALPGETPGSIKPGEAPPGK